MSDHVESPCIAEALPTIGEVCAKAAYEAHRSPREDGEEWPAFEALAQDAKDRWERVAMAAASTFLTERICDVINERWRGEAALGDLLRKGG